MLCYYSVMLMPLCVGIVLVLVAEVLLLVSEILVLVLVLEATVLETSLFVIFQDKTIFGVYM